MLEQKLAPLLAELRKNPGFSKKNYEITREWFAIEIETLAETIDALPYLCELPDDERRLVTYPVIGNWFLGKLDTYVPQSAQQSSCLTMVRALVREDRFNNPHLERFYDKKEEYNTRLDELSSFMLAHPTHALPVHQLMERTNKEIASAVYGRRLPHKEYTCDLGHGLAAPSGHFAFITWYFGTMVDDGEATPLDATIMVIDNEHPEAWYRRMVAVGFKDVPGQQGFFFDCESALAALPHAQYDVILTDLELGDGKMDGISFVEKAYAIQKAKGTKPLLSVFSYNNALLEMAEKRLRDLSTLYEPKVFEQVDHNNKAGFAAIKFRQSASYALPKRGKSTLPSSEVLSR